MARAGAWASQAWPAEVQNHTHEKDKESAKDSMVNAYLCLTMSLGSAHCLA